MAGETLTAADTEMYGGRAFMAYQVADLYGTDRMDFYGVKPTEKVNVPVWENDTAVNKSDGVTHLDGESDVTGHEVPLFAPVKAYSHITKEQVDVRPDLQLLQRRGMKQGQAVGNGKTLRLTGFLANIADGAGNTIEIDARTESTLVDEVARGVEAIQVAFDNLEIPPQDRFGKLNSTLFYKLARHNLFFSKDYGGAANIQNLGMGFEFPLYNFKIGNCPIAFGNDLTDQAFDAYNLPTVSQFDLSNVVGVFWHKDAWALRHQTSLETTAGWVEHFQAWLTMARLHCGYGVIQTDGVWILVNSNPTNA